jgi:myo-inositol-1(or 4)-monophosphatase
MINLPDSGAVQDLVTSAALEELFPRFNEIGHDLKANGSVVTEADLAIDKRLKNELSERWPDIEVLSEEMPKQRQDELLRNSKRLLWCLDPLDGTTNFAAGIPLFGVSIALIFKGEPILGVIYDPIRDECYRAEKGQGVWLNERVLIPNDVQVSLNRALAIVDFKRLNPSLSHHLVRQPPYRSQRNFGCCVLEWVWMAAGKGHLYLHGGQKIWDYAAGSLILKEAGGYSASLEGDPIFEASLAPRSVVASPNAKLFEAWQNWLKQHASAGKP